MLMVSRLVYLAISALALTGAQTDVKDALKQLGDYRNKLVEDSRKAGKELDYAILGAQLKTKANELLQGLKLEEVKDADGYSWARIFMIADRYQESCDLSLRFLKTKPGPELQFEVQNHLLRGYNALGDGDKLVSLLREVKPPNVDMARGLVSSAVYEFSDTILKTRGVDQTIRILDEVLAKMPPQDHKESAKKALKTAKDREAKTPPTTPPKPDAERLAQFEKSSIDRENYVRYDVVEKKFNLLKSSGRLEEARASIKEFVATVDPTSSVARMAKSQIQHVEMIGTVAPALASKRGYGEFKGMDALKGKVVIVDFFAHWCGPCKASYPDMRRLYDDLGSKGLEVVGVTRFYGYYNQEKDLTEDAEYAKMAGFLKEYGISWPVIFVEKEGFEAYGATAIPHVTVIDRKGKVHAIEIGYTSTGFVKFRQEIEKLLAEK